MGRYDPPTWTEKRKYRELRLFMVTDIEGQQHRIGAGTWGEALHMALDKWEITSLRADESQYPYITVPE